MRDENMNCCGKKIKKETLVLGAFYSIAFITSILIPNIIAVAIGAGITGSFCQDNKDICDKYTVVGQKTSLKEQIESLGYVEAAITSILGGIIVGALLFLTKLLLDCCKEREKSDTEASFDAADDHESNDTCRLFKACKENILPTKFEVAQLLMTAITLMGAAAFAVWFNAVLTSDLCNGDCTGFFPGATPDQLKTVTNFSNDLYKTMLISGIVLGTISSLTISIGSMAIASCIKYRMSSAAEGRLLINDDDDQSYGSGGQHRFEL